MNGNRKVTMRATGARARFRLAGVMLVSLTLLATYSIAWAHAPGVILSAVGTATIDGRFTPGEWDSAAKIDFLATLPVADGGGTTPATLFVMNDGTNLYLAVRVMRSQLNTGGVGFGLDQVMVEFDNDHDEGDVEEGDDILLLSPGLDMLGLSSFFDEVRTSRPPCPVTLCGFLDAQLEVAGTNDGAGAAGNDGRFTLFEMSHPLDSRDDLNDFSLAWGDSVGFRVQVSLTSLTPFCTADCAAYTLFPSADGGRGDIDIKIPAISVTIDVRPGTPQNSANPISAGVIPVAVMSSAAFDAKRVNPSTVRFGQTGTEAAPEQFAMEDVDGDRDADLVLHFATMQTHIVCGDASVSLTGLTWEGQAITGFDLISTVGCARR